jgi:hypothetical protein
MDRPDPPPGACVPWLGHIMRNGYGIAHANGKTTTAHRVVWERERGPIPPGLQIDHLCRNRACVNVAHLEPVTHRVNDLRGEGVGAIHARKSACIHGHEFSPENTSMQRHGNYLTRVCRTCRRARRVGYRQRVRLAATG